MREHNLTLTGECWLSVFDVLEQVPVHPLPIWRLKVSSALNVHLLHLVLAQTHITVALQQLSRIEWLPHCAHDRHVVLVWHPHLLRLVIRDMAQISLRHDAFLQEGVDDRMADLHKLVVVLIFFNVTVEYARGCGGLAFEAALQAFHRKFELLRLLSLGGTQDLILDVSLD